MCVGKKKQAQVLPPLSEICRAGVESGKSVCAPQNEQVPYAYDNCPYTWLTLSTSLSLHIFFSRVFVTLRFLFVLIFISLIIFTMLSEDLDISE